MTSLVGFMLGDFLAQRIEGRPFNPVRFVTAVQLQEDLRWPGEPEHDIHIYTEYWTV